MRATIRVSGDKDGRSSTEATIEIQQEWNRIRLRADANWQVDYFSMRPAEARMIAAALLEASMLAEESSEAPPCNVEIRT